MRRFCLRLASEGDVLRTRDRREVMAWRTVGDPRESLWCVEVTVNDPQGELTYRVNQNGHRYANVKSSDDILVVDDARLGCMPEPLKAIECAKRGDMPGIRSANKTWDVAPEPLLVHTEIGWYNN